MRPGELNRTIEIQSRTETPDSFGDPVESWASVATVSAKVSGYRGNESFTEGQFVGKQTATFKIRWRAGLTAKHRIVYDSENWDIIDIRPLGNRDALEIDAYVRAD